MDLAAGLLQASTGECEGWTFSSPGSVDALQVDVLLASPAQEAVCLLSAHFRKEGLLAGSRLHCCLACSVPVSLARQTDRGRRATRSCASLSIAPPL